MLVAYTFATIRLSEIDAALKEQTGKLTTVDLDFLRNSRLVNQSTRTVKVFLSGVITKSIKLMVPATAGVKKAVQEAGGECHGN